MRVTKTSIPENAVPVLDKGFVAVKDKLGSDITPVNAARISFGKEVAEFDPEKDGKLLDYLASHGHTSPYRHAVIQFHIKAPEVVLRQWWKHIIGCEWTAGQGSFKDTAWNELSGRYVEFEPEFYVPEVFRPQSKDNKQASDEGDLSDELTGMVDNEMLNNPLSVREIYDQNLSNSYRTYEAMLEAGVAKEQARMVLPITFYTELYWTVSLQAVAHFCKLRIHEGAQWEIQEYAKAIQTLTEREFPNAFKALVR
jgi:thymidylate synthase (FAD)